MKNVLRVQFTPTLALHISGPRARLQCLVVGAGIADVGHAAVVGALFSSPYQLLIPLTSARGHVGIGEGAMEKRGGKRKETYVLSGQRAVQYGFLQVLAIAMGVLLAALF